MSAILEETLAEMDLLRGAGLVYEGCRWVRRTENGWRYEVRRTRRGAFLCEAYCPGNDLSVEVASFGPGSMNPSRRPAADAAKWLAWSIRTCPEQERGM